MLELFNRLKKIITKEDNIVSNHSVELKPSTESKYLPTAINLKKEMLPFLTEEQLYALNMVLSEIATHDNTYFNTQIGGANSKENALHILKKCIQSNKSSLDIIYEVSILLAYPTSFVNENNQWLLKEDVILGRVALEKLKQLHCWKLLPTANKETLEAKLLNLDNRVIIQADSNLIIKEKELTWVDYVEKLSELERKAFDCFIDFLPHIIFKTPALKKGIVAYGWKQHNKLYLLEIQIREKILALLSEKDKQLFFTESEPIHRFSYHLFNALNKVKWLVTEYGLMKTGNVPFWEVKVGDNQFKGVFILTIPEEFLTSMTEHNTTYSITILKPQYEKVKESNKLKTNVINSLFKQ